MGNADSDLRSLSGRVCVSRHCILADAARSRLLASSIFGLHAFSPNSLGLLFANRCGRPLSANKLPEKKLRPLLLSLGLRSRLSCVQARCGYDLIDRGASITTVGAQLRHSDQESR